VLGRYLSRICLERSKACHRGESLVVTIARNSETPQFAVTESQAPTLQLRLQLSILSFVGFAVGEADGCRFRTPRVKKRTALLRTLKPIFRSHGSRPISEGDCTHQPDSAWLGAVRAVGHSSRCFSYIRDWVEKKIRHHSVRAS
jgi:hypothetical protein